MWKRVDFGWLIFGCAFDWVVLVILYHSLFFRCLPGMGFRESEAVLAGMAAAMTAAGALVFGVLMGKNDEKTALLVVLFPYGLYSLGAYGADFPLLFGAAAWGALVLGGLYTVLRLAQTLHHRRPLRVLVRRCGFCLYAGFCLLSGALGCCLLFLGVRALVFNSMVPGPAPARTSLAPAQRDLDSHKDQLALLAGDRWDTLTLQEKLGVMQVIVDIESSYLGLPTELSVSCLNLEENVLSAYSPARETIIFAIDSLARDTAEELVNSALHEVRHSYQYALIDAYCSTDAAYRDLLLFQNVPALIYEFSNYQDTGLDYYTQISEQDARIYAQETAELYAQALADWGLPQA